MKIPMFHKDEIVNSFQNLHLRMGKLEITVIFVLMSWTQVVPRTRQKHQKRMDCLGKRLWIGVLSTVARIGPCETKTTAFFKDKCTKGNLQSWKGE